jgi:hypothetical protein
LSAKLIWNVLSDKLPSGLVIEWIGWVRESVLKQIIPGQAAIPEVLEK